MSPRRIVRALAVVLAVGVAAPGASQVRDSRSAVAHGPVAISVTSALRGVSGEAGMFVVRGAVRDWGAEDAVFTESRGGFVVRTTLTGQRGALVVEEVLLPARDAVAGRWSVVSGTGIYRAARGGGSTSMVRTSTGAHRVLVGTL